MKPACCSDIPPEAMEAICDIGGTEGLVALLPDDEALSRLREFHHICSDDYRLRILSMLGIRPLCACIIGEVLGIAKSKLSYHLKLLQDGGMIAGTAKGTFIVYELTGYGRFCLSLNAGFLAYGREAD
ncbi:MAG TPA: ArsR family transcriptional regulator [Methanoculleus sp.]|nr:ArsR family transcriptional regulator [Methanoculleus sp.]